ncbi:MAG: hypothetical protein LUG99_09185 [Lachnospiraceae bacterium]|nr:hypothetical protein [Lachnospiraceae bacterium]
MGKAKKNPEEEKTVTYHERASAIAHGYLHWKELAEQYRREADHLPEITWADAYTALSGGGGCQERVQTSNLSDLTCRIAISIDEQIEQMKREMREELQSSLEEAKSNVSLFESAMTWALLLMETEPKEYGDTYSVAQQVFIRGVHENKARGADGRKLSEYKSKQETEKFIDLLAQRIGTKEVFENGKDKAAGSKRKRNYGNGGTLQPLCGEQADG